MFCSYYRCIVLCCEVCIGVTRGGNRNREARKIQSHTPALNPAQRVLPTKTLFKFRQQRKYTKVVTYGISHRKNLIWIKINLDLIKYSYKTKYTFTFTIS